MTIKEYFKDKRIGYYCAVGCALTGIVATVTYAVYSSGVGHFNALVFVLTLLGTLSTALMIVTKFRFAPLVSGVFLSAAFGTYANDRVIMFEEMINGIYGMSERGAILGTVIFILVMMLLSVACCAVAAFTERNKIYTQSEKRSE